MAATVSEALRSQAPECWQLLGPSPSPLSRIKGVWRWHILVKAPADAPVSVAVAEALKTVKRREGVSVGVDIDPIDLL
jgi:primosomal protein N' (replication factor Y)